jgi:hypothetical protein
MQRGLYIGGKLFFPDVSALVQHLVTTADTLPTRLVLPGSQVQIVLPHSPTASHHLHAPWFRPSLTQEQADALIEFEPLGAFVCFIMFL